MRRPRLNFFSRILNPHKSSLLETLALPGPHERALQTMFKDRLCYTNETPEFSTPLVIVAFTNRSGSNLVCDYLLQSARIAGAGEFLNHNVVAERANDRSIDSLPDYIHNLHTEFAQPHKALAIKASWDQLAMLIRARIPSMFENTVVLHCQRNDALAQAVSYSIALRTGQWMSRQKGNTVEVSDIPRGEIERQVESFHLANLLIRLLCDAHSLRRWDIGYERLCQDKGAHLATVLRSAGLVPPGWMPNTPTLERQAGSLNRELAADFLAQIRQITKPPQA